MDTGGCEELPEQQRSIRVLTKPRIGVKKRPLQTLPNPLFYHHCAARRHCARSAWKWEYQDHASAPCDRLGKFLGRLWWIASKCENLHPRMAGSWRSFALFAATGLCNEDFACKRTRGRRWIRSLI